MSDILSKSGKGGGKGGEVGGIVKEKTISVALGTDSWKGEGRGKKTSKKKKEKEEIKTLCFPWTQIARGSGLNLTGLELERGR